MKTHFLIKASAIIGMAFTSCNISVNGESFGGETIKGNGNIVTRNYEIGAFDDLTCMLPATVNFTVANEYSCTVRVDENLLEYFDIMVKKDELVMERLKVHKNIKLRPTEFVIDITAPSVDEVNLAGSGTINFLNPMNAKKMELSLAGSGDINFKEAAAIDHLEMQVAGSGDIRVLDLVCDKLEVDVAGSGNVKIDSGRVNEAEVNVAGSGDCDLACEIDTLEADIAGSGDVTAKVNNKLEYSIIGSGDIAYYGNPVVEGNKVGSGSVRRKE